MKRCIVYGTAWLVLLGGYIYTAGYGVFVVLVIMAVLPLLSTIYALVVREHLSIDINNSQDVLIRGEKLGYDVVIRNTSLFLVSDFNLVVKCTYSNYPGEEKHNYQISIDGTDKEIVRIDQPMTLVGLVSVDTSQSYIMDPLRMFKFTIRRCDGCKVTVMPVLNEPDQYAMYNWYQDDLDSSDYSKKRKGDDASQIFDIRNYNDGDSLNRIHWKLSAKEDELLVKEFSYPITKNNCILLEIHQFTDIERRYDLNGVFEMVYAIGNLACLKEKEFFVAFYSVAADELKVVPVLSSDELTEIMRLIIQEPAYEGNKALELYIQSDISKDNRFYYVTDQCDEEVLNIEDTVPGNGYIYCVNGSGETGKLTKLPRNVLLEVDRDDVKWGLWNTRM